MQRTHASLAGPSIEGAGMDLEVRSRRGMRRWTLDELRTTAATVSPADLAELVEAALADSG